MRTVASCSSVLVCCGVTAGKWVTNVATNSKSTKPAVIPNANSEDLGVLYLAILIIDADRLEGCPSQCAVPSFFDH